MIGEFPLLIRLMIHGLLLFLFDSFLVVLVVLVHHAVRCIFELTKRLSGRATKLWQFLRSEDDKRDDGDDE